MEFAYSGLSSLYLIMGLMVMAVLPVTVILKLTQWFGKQGRNTVNTFRR